MEKQTLNRQQEQALHEKKAVASYLIGFILSLFLTMVAYWLVAGHLISGWRLTTSIMGIGFLQAAIQLIFFLHLADEPKPRWNLYALLFMLMILTIIVVGSIWVMANLDYRMMPQM